MSVAELGDGMLMRADGAGDWQIRIRLAASWPARLVGLLGTAQPPAAGHGLLLAGRGGVHTLGMRYAIDIAYLDAGLCVLAQRPAVPPGRLVRAPAASRASLETAPGGLPAALLGCTLQIAGAAP